MDATKLMALMKDKKAAMARRDKTVKPRPGKNRIVLLQGWRSGEEHVWFHDFGQHFVKNAAKEIQAVYPCLDATFGKPCPICEGLAAAARTVSDDDTQNLLGEAAASRTVLINALDLDGENPSTPVIYEIKRSVFGQIVDLINEWGAEAFKREIVINREGKGLNTKYTAQISPKAVEVSPATIAKINDLDEYVKQESEEQERRALTAINKVAGLLSAPSSGSTGDDRDRPATKPSVIDGQDEELRAMEERASKPATAPKPATASVDLDEELESLLGGIE